MLLYWFYHNLFNVYFYVDNVFACLTNSANGCDNGREYATFIIYFCTVCTIESCVIFIHLQQIIKYNSVEIL